MDGRFARLLAGLVVIGGLGGCSLGGVKFTNVSDFWLNVSYYVGATDLPSDGTNEMFRQRALQIEPGASASYRPPHNLVHVQVETVSPTWVPTGASYWLELMTPPPLHVVAGGHGDKIEFKSFRGEIAIIPERELESGRFVYRTEREPVVPEPEPDPAAAGVSVADDEPRWNP